ncbi:hypothetical protein MBLNU459_g4593t2 [Dothideomycetes sp. NU459]
MGFFNHCWEAFLQLAAFAHYLDDGSGQQPLPLPDRPNSLHKVAATGVVFAPQNATAGFTCQYPSLTGWNACNSPDDRQCWLDNPSQESGLNQYNITTDYEQFTPPGIQREYWLEVDTSPLSPDGYLKPLGQVFNGTYPGPKLEACWGDEIIVHVTNKIDNNGTTVHWHGVRQQGTNQMDGVNDGIAGPLTLYGPSSADYDEALEPILVNDWMHDTANNLFKQELNGGIPILDSILLGGTANSVGGPYTTIFKKGKRYIVRLINASSESMFIFSIDNHKLIVVGTDLVPIQPYTTDSIFIGIGQRYTFIVEAIPQHPSADGNYFIRTRIATGCGSVQHDDETTGIVRYDPSSTAAPSTHAQHDRTLCEDEPAEKLRPVVPWQLTASELQNKPTDNLYEAGISDNIDHGYTRWDLLDQALFLNYSDPTILHTDRAVSAFNPDYCVVDYDYAKGYVYLVITGQNISSLKRKISAAHPIHLHGHDFVILAQDNSTFNETRDIPNFNFNNPPRRDVALLYSEGYLALAFKPDNPGVWLVHCHIAFHAASGLALQIMERESQILSALGGETSLDPVDAGCQSWTQWGVYNEPAQDDSGI